MIDRGTTLEALREGEIEILGRIVESSQQRDAGQRHPDMPGARTARSSWTRSTSRPVGERPLDDFPDGTLARREVAAWHVSEATGWGIVPPTILRDGPFGEGMLQVFVEIDPAVDVVAMVDRRTIRACAGWRFSTRS